MHNARNRHAPEQGIFLPAGLLIVALVVALGGLLASSGANAARVTYDGGFIIAPSLILTDNVCLTDGNEKSAVVAQVGTIAPSGSVAITSARGSANIGGSIQFNNLSNNELQKKCGGGDNSFDKRDQYVPRIRASGGYRLIGNNLRVNFTARADQNSRFTSVGGGDDPLDRRGNTNNYLRYNISPSWTSKLTNATNVTARYQYDELINSKSKSNDSIRNAYTLAFRNSSSSQVSWTLLGRHSTVEYKNSLSDNPIFSNLKRDSTLESVRLNLGYRFGRQLQINGWAGREWNDFSFPSNYPQQDNEWGLDFRYTPNRRTSATLGVSDRFFGKTPIINIQHSSDRSTFRLGYRKQLTYDRDIRSEDNGGIITNEGENSSLFSRNPLLEERFTVGYSYAGRKAKINFYANYSEQVRDIDDAKGIFKNINLTYSPYLSSRYNLSYRLGWGEDEPRAARLPIFGDEEPTTSTMWSAGVTFGRQLNTRLNLGVTYLYTDRSSEREFGDYTENRIWATLSIYL